MVAARREASAITRSPALSQLDDVERVGALGGAVLGVGVVDVEPGAVGQYHVRQAEVLVGEGVGRVVGGPGVGEAARVAQRRLLFVVPAGAAAAVQLGPGAVGVDHLRRGDHRVGAGLPGHGNAVLDLGAHDPSNAHATTPPATMPPAAHVSSLDALRRFSPSPRARRGTLGGRKGHAGCGRGSSRAVSRRPSAWPGQFHHPVREPGEPEHHQRGTPARRATRTPPGCVSRSGTIRGSRSSTMTCSR